MPAEARAIDPAAFIRGDDFIGGRATAAGITITEDKALSLTAVWACVSLISDALAILPLDAYRRNGRIRTEVSPQPQWLAQPNKETNRYEFVQRVTSSALLAGNSYNFINRSATGQVLELWPIHPSEVRVDRDKSNNLLYHVQSPTMGSGDLSPFEMLHIPAFTLAGSCVGISPVEQARQAIALGLATEEFGSRWFGDGANPSGVLETDNNLDLDAAKVVQETWRENHGRRRRLPAVLSGGFKWKPITISPEESQFLQTRSFQTAEIARWFRVPPHLISDVEKTTSWGTGIEEQNLAFLTYTLGPWLTRIELALSALLPRPQYVKFNAEALLRARTLERYQAHAIAIEHGWENADGVREDEDEPPLPDGQGETYYRPANLMPVGSPAPPPPKAQPQP